VLQGLGRLPEAKEAWEQALAVQEKFEACNNLAGLLANSAYPRLRDPDRAVELAKKAVELAPKRCEPLGTLGVALYRTGDWNGAVDALQKSNQTKEHGSSYIFLAMAHWQLGDKEQAGQCFHKAVKWMEKNKPDPADDESWRRDRAEAAALLGIKDEPPGKQD
jgi:uncharacterized protein HemY